MKALDFYVQKMSPFRFYEREQMSLYVNIKFCLKKKLG